MARIVRSSEIKIGLDPQMMDRLVKLSPLLGMPVATLASMAVGEYVARREREIGMFDRLTEGLVKQAGDMMRAEVENTSPAVEAKLQQLKLDVKPKKGRE